MDDRPCFKRSGSGTTTVNTLTSICRKANYFQNKKQAEFFSSVVYRGNTMKVERQKVPHFLSEAPSL